MTGQACGQEVERFRAAITRCLGLQFDDAKLGFLAEILKRRLDKLQASSESYLQLVERGPSLDEMSALGRELTVAETHFFRNIEQFNALAEMVLPARMQAKRGPQTLRILSAGCASGEEAYSIAIVARKAIAGSSWTVDLRAVDLNPAGLEKAARGRYPIWALRETPADIRDRCARCDAGRGNPHHRGKKHPRRSARRACTGQCRIRRLCGALDLRKGLKVLFATGYAQAAQERELETEHLLRKPYRVADLARKIRQALATCR